MEPELEVVGTTALLFPSVACSVTGRDDVDCVVGVELAGDS